MKVINNKDGKSKLFGHLNHGDDFGHSGNVYIKIRQVKDQSNGSNANAVRLRDGYLGTFDENTQVSVTNATVTYD